MGNFECGRGLFREWHFGNIFGHADSNSAWFGVSEKQPSRHPLSTTLFVLPFWLSVGFFFAYLWRGGCIPNRKDHLSEMQPTAVLYPFVGIDRLPASTVIPLPHTDVILLWVTAHMACWQHALGVAPACGREFGAAGKTLVATPWRQHHFCV